MANTVRQLDPATHEVEQLWQVFRASRSNYATICQVLVERGILAEMPKDLDKPIKV